MKDLNNVDRKKLQNHSAIEVQRDDFPKHINRKTQPPPHAAAPPQFSPPSTPNLFHQAGERSSESELMKTLTAYSAQG